MGGCDMVDQSTISKKYPIEYRIVDSKRDKLFSQRLKDNRHLDPEGSDREISLEPSVKNFIRASIAAMTVFQKVKLGLVVVAVLTTPLTVYFLIRSLASRLLPEIMMIALLSLLSYFIWNRKNTLTSLQRDCKKVRKDCKKAYLYIKKIYERAFAYIKNACQSTKKLKDA